MLSAGIAAALVLGLVAWRFGLPPLVGFLLTGFVFSAFGVAPPEALDEFAHAGILLLLFGVGLKLRFKTLIRKEVLGTAVGHITIVGAATAGLLLGLVESTWQTAVVLAVAFTFSSTVLAAKVLESLNELRAVHGRIAIGILIVQDIAAVACLAAISAQVPSPYAALWLLLPLLRPVLGWLLDMVGHDELLVLFGAVVAIVVGGTGFEVVGLSSELGALLMGTLLAGHQRAQELSNAIWGLKELFLIGFFLSIGFSGLPTTETFVLSIWAMLLLPLKIAVLFGLLLVLGLRARTSFLTSLSLATYSEFGLIVIKAAVDDGMLGNEWLITAAVTVAISFALAAILNADGHGLYAKYAHLLRPLARNRPHPDDEPITLGSAEILIMGMGRVGTGAYDYLHGIGELVVGADSDPGKLENHRQEGKRVVYADSEDAAFWQRLNIDKLKAVMVAVPDMHSKQIAGRELRRRGFTGLLVATHIYPEQEGPILEAGFNETYNYFTEAGVGFARDMVEVLHADEEVAE